KAALELLDEHRIPYEILPITGGGSSGERWRDCPGTGRRRDNRSSTRTPWRTGRACTRSGRPRIPKCAHRRSSAAAWKWYQGDPASDFVEPGHLGAAGGVRVASQHIGPTCDSD